MIFVSPLLKLRHAEHCHKLEKDKEQYVQEWQVGQTQVETLQKTLEEHRLLLADKVPDHDYSNSRNDNTDISRSMKLKGVFKLLGRKSGINL